MESRAVVPDTPSLLPYAYAPLPCSADDRQASAAGGVRWRACAAVLAAVVLVVVAAIALLGGARMVVDRSGNGGGDAVPAMAMEIPRSRGKDFGVSEKASGAYSVDGGFPWSNTMLQWQRTGFHFQPDMHYMNGTCVVRSIDFQIQIFFHRSVEEYIG